MKVPEKVQAGNSSQQIQTDDSGTEQAPHGSVEAESTSLNEFDLEVVRNLNALAVEGEGNSNPHTQDEAHNYTGPINGQAQAELWDNRRQAGASNRKQVLQVGTQTEAPSSTMSASQVQQKLERLEAKFGEKLENELRSIFDQLLQELGARDQGWQRELQELKNQMNCNEKATAALSMQQSELKTELGSLTRKFRADLSNNNYVQPLTRMETMPPSTPLCPGTQMHPQADKFLQGMRTEIYP